MPEWWGRDQVAWNAIGRQVGTCISFSKPLTISVSLNGIVRYEAYLRPSMTLTKVLGTVESLGTQVNSVEDHCRSNMYVTARGSILPWNRVKTFVLPQGLLTCVIVERSRLTLRGSYY